MNELFLIAISKVLMILMARCYWYWLQDVNIPQLSPNYTLHTLHTTVHLLSDQTDRAIQLTSFMRPFSVSRDYIYIYLCFIIFGCYIDTLHIDFKIVFTCTAGSRRIHWGRWWVQRFLLPETRRPVISSLGESSPRSKHTPAPAHHITWDVT